MQLINKILNYSARKKVSQQLDNTRDLADSDAYKTLREFRAWKHVVDEAAVELKYQNDILQCHADCTDEERTLLYTEELEKVAIDCYSKLLECKLREQEHMDAIGLKEPSRTYVHIEQWASVAKFTIMRKLTLEKLRALSVDDWTRVQPEILKSNRNSMLFALAFHRTVQERCKKHPVHIELTSMLVDCTDDIKKSAINDMIIAEYTSMERKMRDELHIAQDMYLPR